MLLCTVSNVMILPVPACFLFLSICKNDCCRPACIAVSRLCYNGVSGLQNALSFGVVDQFQADSVRVGADQPFAFDVRMIEDRAC